ncbi:MFS transporter [Chloroflexota bacterium]
MGDEISTPPKIMKQKFFYGYVVALAGFGVWFMGFATQSTFSVFFLPVSNDFGWTRAETALASALYGLMGGVLALGMGWLTDRLGPRIVVTVFGSFVAISFLMLSQMHSLWEFDIYYALIASVGMSTASVPIMATVSRWFVRRRGLMSGLVQAGTGVGGFTNNLLAGWLIINYGWRNAYLGIGILALVILISSGMFLRRDPRDMGLLPDGAVPSGKPEDKTKPKAATPAFSLRSMVKTHQFWVIAGLFFVFGYCRSTFITHTAPHVQDLGFSLSDAATVMAIISLSSIVGRIVMGRASDTMGIRAAMVISYAATTVDMIWGMYASSLWGLYIYAFIFGFGWGAQAVLRFPATAAAFGTRSAGLVMGIMGIFENVIAAAIGVFMAGWVFDLVGSYQPIYWSGLGVSLVGVILAAMVKPSEQKTAAH